MTEPETLVVLPVSEIKSARTESRTSSRRMPVCTPIGAIFVCNSLTTLFLDWMFMTAFICIYRRASKAKIMYVAHFLRPYHALHPCTYSTGLADLKQLFEGFRNVPGIGSLSDKKSVRLYSRLCLDLRCARDIQLTRFGNPFALQQCITHHRVYLLLNRRQSRLPVRRPQSGSCSRVQQTPSTGGSVCLERP